MYVKSAVCKANNIFETYEDIATGSANTSISTTPHRFEDARTRNAFEYLQTT